MKCYIKMVRNARILRMIRYFNMYKMLKQLYFILCFNSYIYC